MSFHQNSFKIIGTTPAVSQSALDQLRALEDRCPGGLPIAVKEWYALADSHQILRKATCHSPVPVTELGEPIDWLDAPIDLVTQELLMVMSENQGACHWAVTLNSEENPPVLVSYDLTQANSWQPYAESFSAFIETVLIDERWAIKLSAQDIQLREQDLEFLRKMFSAGPVTYNWPGLVNYRFVRDDQYILLWDGEGQCDWKISALDIESLLKLTKIVWQLGELAENLYATYNDGAAVLDEIRSGSTAGK